MYWCVFSIFGILEYFSDYLLVSLKYIFFLIYDVVLILSYFKFWIPFYSLSKCAFLIWLMMSGRNSGTHIIYNNILRPFMNKHQNKIDNTIENARDISKYLT
jgi:receptor expression-enhancing protein 5/6